MSDTIPPTMDYKTQLLLDCALIISGFRRKLQDAGYPFREPAKVTEILLAIDAECFDNGTRPRNHDFVLLNGSTTASSVTDLIIPKL